MGRGKKEKKKRRGGSKVGWACDLPWKHKGWEILDQAGNPTPCFANMGLMGGKKERDGARGKGWEAFAERDKTEKKHQTTRDDTE